MYLFSKGIFSIEQEAIFEAGNNYFFRGSYKLGGGSILPVKNIDEIKSVMENIKSGYYEHGDLDN